MSAAAVQTVTMMFRFSRLPLGSGNARTFAPAAAPWEQFVLGLLFLAA